MVLGSSNISISAVKAAGVSVGSNSLGDLITKSQLGGVGGYAFYLYETRASNNDRYDGVLIANAKPFWNMFSNKIPARWFSDTDYKLNLRLPRNVSNAKGGYDFRLHDFREYEHDSSVSRKPEIQVAKTSIEVWEGSTVGITARFYKWLIDLSTANRVGGELTHYIIRFTIGGVDYDTPAIPLDNSGSNEPTYSWTGWATNKNITLTVILLPSTLSLSQSVILPTQFFKLNSTDGANTIAVTIIPYPRLTVDASSIYPVSIPYLTDYSSYDWDTETQIQGACFFTDGSGNVIPEPSVKANGVLMQAIPVTFIGEFDGYVDAVLYKNGVQIGNTLSSMKIMSDKTYVGWTRSLSFGVESYSVNQGDVFQIVLTES